MSKKTTYTIETLTAWNDDRKHEIDLDAVGQLYLDDSDITDRDRLALPLRELRNRGYDVEAYPDAYPDDWTRPLMISSVTEPKLRSGPT